MGVPASEIHIHTDAGKSNSKVVDGCRQAMEHLVNCLIERCVHVDSL